ncbi:unnamed protein product [Rotaria magnacalcarata]|uniref:Uncharacterized protein n=2 Tax=Rotaria magnacalcarata TaxID=392030 RepID=A0A815L7Y1_9BILA|nr:unnamed protein product [Rotaria magnacalcarata]
MANQTEIQNVNMNDGKNRENLTLIWFDSNTRLCKDTEKIIRQLRLVNDYVILCSDREECIRRVQLINKETVFLITSGAKSSQILPRISSFHQVDSVFIFNKEKIPCEDVLTEYSNVIGVYLNLEDLYLSRESANFLWFQLFYQTLTCLPRSPQAKQQMIQACREYYDGNTNEMKFIDDFEENYRSEDAIVWYLKRSFVSKLITKALRTQDIDLSYTFRFFIDDLTENFRHEHEKLLSSKEKMLNAYRGVKFSKEEFDKLQENYFHKWIFFY